MIALRCTGLDRGSATRAIALAIDAAVTLVLFMSVVGVVALVSSLVGGLHPDWLVGASPSHSCRHVWGLRV